MEYLFYDVETSGLAKTSYTKILSLGYVVTTDSFAITEFGELFFKQEREVPISAASVNGLTKQKLEFLSEGRSFADNMEKIYQLFTKPGRRICGYNIKEFDNRILNINMEFYGGLRIPFDNCLDIFETVAKQYSQGSRKLGDVFRKVCDKNGLTTQMIEMAYTQVTGKNGQLHGALFDAFVTSFIHFYNK